MLREMLGVPLVLALALPALAQEPALQPKKLTLKAAAAPCLRSSIGYFPRSAIYSRETG